ncbi:MAG: hypothetical protein WA139_04705 [Candidatus Aenigmatarchaeota archaeon]
MIMGYNALKDRIIGYRFCRPNTLEYSEKLELFDGAIDKAVKLSGEEILERQDKIHMGYSGGVDSSLMLLKLLQCDFPVVAHTMASNENHPDLVYATDFVSFLAKNGKCIEHKKHIVAATADDLENYKLAVNQPSAERVDEYFMLFKNVHPHSRSMVQCDCIDELMGGYYAHQKAEERLKSLEESMSKLIPDHLQIAEQTSNHFSIDVYVPYGDKEVMKAASLFTIPELVDNERRKKPVYDLAKRNGVPEAIIKRRKYGLVSALENICLPTEHIKDRRRR